MRLFISFMGVSVVFILLYRAIRVGIDYTTDLVYLEWNRPLKLSSWALKIMFFKANLEYVPLFAFLYQLIVTAPIVLTAPIHFYTFAALAGVITIEKSLLVKLLWVFAFTGLYLVVGMIVFEALKKLGEANSDIITRFKVIFPWKFYGICVVITSIALLVLGYYDSPRVVFGGVMFISLIFLPAYTQKYMIDDCYLHLANRLRFPLEKVKALKIYPKQQLLMEYQAIRIYDFDGNSFELRAVDSQALTRHLLQKNPVIEVLEDNKN